MGMWKAKILLNLSTYLFKENICLTFIISDVLLETLSVPSVSGNSLHNHQVNIIRVKEVSTISKKLSYEEEVWFSNRNSMQSDYLQ